MRLGNWAAIASRLLGDGRTLQQAEPTVIQHFLRTGVRQTPQSSSQTARSFLTIATARAGVRSWVDQAHTQSSAVATGTQVSSCVGFQRHQWWATTALTALGGAQLQLRRGLLMQPRRTKFRKAFKGLGFGGAVKGNDHQLSMGLYGIRAVTGGRVPANVLEALRRTIRRKIRKNAMMWICVSPSIPVSKKPAEIRMGKGKGAVQFYAARVQPGQILFEFDNITRSLALQALEAVQPKTGLKLGFVEWN